MGKDDVTPNVGFGVVKNTYNAKEQIETVFTGFLKGLGTNSIDDVSRLDYLEVSSRKTQMPVIAGEITRFASYNQTPTVCYHLGQNCAIQSGTAPNMARVTYAYVNDMMRKYLLVHDRMRRIKFLNQLKIFSDACYLREL